MLDDREEWRAISAVPGYEVSNLGRVRRGDTQVQKATVTNRSGYAVSNLWRRNVGKVCYVHDLVAAAFIGPKPAGLSVNHIDGDKLNNRPGNLEYISLAENTRHQMANGLARCRGAQNGHAKLTEEQAREIKRRAKAGERTSALALEFGVKQPIVSQIKSGARWGHLDDHLA